MFLKNLHACNDALTGLTQAPSIVVTIAFPL